MALFRHVYHLGVEPPPTAQFVATVVTVRCAVAPAPFRPEVTLFRVAVGRRPVDEHQLVSSDWVPPAFGPIAPAELPFCLLCHENGVRPADLEDVTYFVARGEGAPAAFEVAGTAYTVTATFHDHRLEDELQKSVRSVIMYKSWICQK